MTKHPRGEAHHNARLSDDQVREMRRVWHEWEAAGSWKGYGEMARIFNISMWTVRDIVTYRTRKTA